MKPKILIVDDDQGTLASLSRAFALEGYTAVTASSAAKGLEKLTEEAVDAVLSDVVMPEMDGPALMKELKKRKPDIKIIFVSGYAEDAFDKSVLREDEQFAFLPKPFALSALVEKVKETMGPSQASGG